MTTCTHTIPVPKGMTPEEAWDEIRNFGRLVQGDAGEGRTWAVIECPDPKTHGMDERAYTIAHGGTWEP